MQLVAIGTAILTPLFALLYGYLGYDFLLSAAITTGTTCYHFIMRLLVGALVPDRFDYRCRWFQQKPFEATFYKKLRLKRWKAQLPTYNPRLFSLEDNSLEQIVRNMCQAEVVHEIIIPLSFLPLFFSSALDGFWPFLITSVLAAAFDSLFVMLQRFNRPRVVKMLEHQIRRSVR